MTRIRHRAAKRAVDLSISTLLVICLSPLLVAIAVLVRTRLGEPVLFRQQRPGLYGRPFTPLEFRTMSDARDERGELLPDEQRLTRLGRFLRSTSLDELPELFNALRGEMSLVGPRPLLMQYLGRYAPGQMRRHEVKPGVTGWAQVKGRNAVTWEGDFAPQVCCLGRSSTPGRTRGRRSRFAAARFRHRLPPRRADRGDSPAGRRDTQHRARAAARGRLPRRALGSVRYIVLREVRLARAAGVPPPAWGTAVPAATAATWVALVGLAGPPLARVALRVQTRQSGGCLVWALTLPAGLACLVVGGTVTLVLARLGLLSRDWALPLGVAVGLCLGLVAPSAPMPGKHRSRLAAGTASAGLVLITRRLGD